jgi:hypothetical protein
MTKHLPFHNFFFNSTIYGLQLANSNFTVLKLGNRREQALYLGPSICLEPHVGFISVGTYWVYLVAGIALLLSMRYMMKERDHLTMVILIIFTIDFQINIKKILKIENNFINMFFYL